ncbi:MAG: TonB family protein, partial [Salinibacter sp.]
LSLSESPSSLKDRLSAMKSSIPSLLSSRSALGVALVVGGLALTLGVVACSDSVAPSTSTETTAATESSSATTTDDEEVYMVVDNQPELVGGMEALQNAVSYPEMAKEAGVEGRVIVQFVVDENGTVTDPTITRGAHKLLNEAALEAVKEQTFKPGKLEGQSVPVQMSLPVTFRLDNGSNDGSDGSNATSETNSGGLLFEKAGIQVVRVLMNAEGDLLLDDKRVELSNLTDAVRQRITEDPARAVLLHDDAVPTDRVAAAKSNLSALDLQKVYVRTVK